MGPVNSPTAGGLRPCNDEAPGAGRNEWPPGPSGSDPVQTPNRSRGRTQSDIIKRGRGERVK